MICVIIIPTYQPDYSLLTLIKSLNLFRAPIIIVNDGSDKAYFPIFKMLEQQMQVTVLHHSINQGKGQALKTGFRYFLEHFSNHYAGVITADADGQHAPSDIHRLCDLFGHSPKTLLLGCRTFQKKVPWRSRLGNILSRATFRFVVGYSLQDTQTGLRALPREFLKSLVKIPLMRYDFELEMLLCAFRQKIPFKEIPIQTIYKDGNQNSHFHPLKDALKIYLVFFRFLGKMYLDRLMERVHIILARAL